MFVKIITYILEIMDHLNPRCIIIYGDVYEIIYSNKYKVTYRTLI